jgi:hypothetical protein
MEAAMTRTNAVPSSEVGAATFIAPGMTPMQLGSTHGSANHQSKNSTTDASTLCPLRVRAGIKRATADRAWSKSACPEIC